MSKDHPAKLSAGEAYFDLFILMFSVIVLILAYRISGFAISGAGTFPMASSAVMVGSMLVVLWGNRKKEKADTDGHASEWRLMMHKVFTRDFLIYTFMTILYVAAIDFIHFLPSSFVFIALSIIFLKGSTPLKAVLISAGTLASIYIVFLYFFKVILP